MFNAIQKRTLAVLALGAVWALQKTLGSNDARAAHARLGTV